MTKTTSKQAELIPDEIEEDIDPEAVAEDILAGDAREEPEIARLADEDKPMFSVLLQAAVAQAAPDDAVLLDYVTHVACPLSAELALVSAKGGEKFIADRLAEGKTDADVARYRHEQSLRAHLVNGLLPTARIARQLQAWGAPRMSRFDERAYRLFCAGFTLHDWLKLPEVDDWLQSVDLAHHTVNPAKHLPLVEEIFRRWCERLGLDEFLKPIGGVDAWLHDLIYLACNAQVRWGTMLNLSALPRLALDGRTRQLATDLCTLADRIAYIARTPRDVPATSSITEIITNLANGEARLLYHHIAENRGVLTNFIQNAALAALETTDCVALLYAPSGVVYLARGAAGATPLPQPAAVAEDVVKRIRQACGQHLRTNLTGFSRDGKGLKYAPYYDLHFAPAGRIRVAAQAAFKRIPETKAPAAGTRFAKMAEKAMAPAEANVALPNDIRVDQLAEFCALATKIVEEAAPALDAADLILTELGLAGERAAFDQIAAFPQAGGVAYHWYYAAGAYLKQGGKGASPAEWQEKVEQLADKLAARVEAATAQQPRTDDGWGDLRAYVARVLSFGPQGADAQTVDVAAAVAAELGRYRMAKAQGRGVSAVCSLCSSSFEINPQREAGILFAPQVYSNKLPLHGSKAIRNICRICEIEMMLRQILMNRQAVAGGRFEGRRMRYLYFYPTYFFTPETLAQMAAIYDDIKHVRFTAVRKALLTEEDGEQKLHVGAKDFQRLGPLLMPPAADPAEDRLFRLRFPQGEPLTFFFLGIPPPGRDAKDAEAWVNPAFLALVLPLAVDVKVVATESSIPLLTEADELDETVFMDAPHDFVKDILGRERIPLEGLLPRLQALTAAYLAHLDGNANFAKGDYRWHTIPPLARNLASDPLWAFAYLKKWQRAQKNIDAITTDKARLYLQLVDILDALKGGYSMSHAKELTTRYMRFYRAKRPYNSNRILRPVTIAAQAILDANMSLFGDLDREGVVEAVRGKLHAFMERLDTPHAEGYPVPNCKGECREEAIRQFAEYFVGTIFYDTLRADKAALRGKQLNLLKNACEVIYVDATAQEWRDRQAATDTKEKQQ
ncbi:MAG: type I-D CRISPR-associated protein Cas10d/Csc3 [Chloroflexi bacterium]|nr:type I-D CRISPR-associated protein Cas10d/Csc3 [Chloroflexota bacterium]